MSNPTFIKFKTKNQPAVINISCIAEIRPNATPDSTYLFLAGRSDDYVIVDHSLDEVCIMLSNWSVVDSTYYK